MVVCKILSDRWPGVLRGGGRNCNALNDMINFQFVTPRSLGEGLHVSMHDCTRVHEVNNLIRKQSTIFCDSWVGKHKNDAEAEACRFSILSPLRYHFMGLKHTQMTTNSFFLRMLLQHISIKCATLAHSNGSLCFVIFKE